MFQVRGHRWSQVTKPRPFPPGPPCFVCGEGIIGKGISLLVGHTAHSKTGLPTKIGQLMGDGFMIVVSMEDMLCKRCSTLINLLDKLEIDLDDVKASLMRYLRLKYQLNDENDEQPNDASYVSSDDGIISLENIKSELVSKESDAELEHGGKDDFSGSEFGEGSPTKKVNVEIILDESHSQRRTLPISQPPEAQLFSYECSKCSFHTNDFLEIEQHPASCMTYQHECRICGQRFDSNKNVQDHIMQTHLSKWTCHFCNTNFTEEQEFVAHMQVHINSGCQAPCESLKNSDGNFECNICTFECSNKTEFDDHLRKHVVLKLFKCKECNKRFEDQQLLQDHYKTHKSLDKCVNICSLMEDCIMDEMKLSSKTSQGLTGDVMVWSSSKDNYLQTHDTLGDSGDLVKSITRQNENADSDQSESGIKFLNCSLCSLTFLNSNLYEQHMKNHSDGVLSTSSKVDIMDAENSLMSSLVDSHSYVDSVMDSSLEDMFEKMHSQVDSSENKPIGGFDPTSNECSKDIFRCDMSTEDILKSSVDERGNQCSVESLCERENIVKKVVSGDSALCDETRNRTNTFSSDSFCIDDHVNPVISSIINASNAISTKSECADGHQLSLENVFSLSQNKTLMETSTNLVDSTLSTNGSVVDAPSTVNTENVVHSFSAEIETLIEEKSGIRKTYVCAICGFKCADMLLLREHFKEHKNYEIHPCNVCKKIFPTKLRLRKHMKVHENTPSGKMTCPHCYQDFPNYFHLYEHMQEKHQKEKIIYNCAFCHQKFTSRRAYKIHEETHPERFEFKCDECNLSFGKEKQLKDHKDANHRDPHCRFCGKEITKLKTLRNHELRHMRDKDNFECDVCKRVFKTKTGLRHHVAVHTGEYKYCCDYCGRGFMSRMMMEEHRSKHTKEERYVCDVCGRKFSFQSTYWIHRKWHDNPYPYKCSFCNRMFRHSSLLAVHKRKHTGERPYKCPHCPLTFPVGGTLKRHLILHTGVYPFNCDSCKRGFTTRHKYATHLAKIHGDYELLNTKPPQGEYKMVIRDEPKRRQDAPMWKLADETEQSDMNFKLEVAGADGMEPIETGIPCSIVSDDLLVDSSVAARVVEIVLDDESQAVATVTLAEPSPSSILPDLWYP